MVTVSSTRIPHEGVLLLRSRGNRCCSWGLLHASFFLDMSRSSSLQCHKVCVVPNLPLIMLNTASCMVPVRSGVSGDVEI